MKPNRRRFGRILRPIDEGRLGLGWMSGQFRWPPPVPLDQIDYFASASPEGCPASSHRKLDRLPPPLIAQIVAALAFPLGAEILASLDVDIGAATAEALPPQHRRMVFRALDAGRAATILERMDAGVAAAILNELPPELAEPLVTLMDPRDSATAQLHRSSPADSAGRLLRPAPLVLPECVTVVTTIQSLRAVHDLAETTPSVYLVETQTSDRSTGRVRLGDLLLADPRTPLWALSEDDPIVGHPEDPAEDVVGILLHHHLSALPIVNNEHRLLGIVPLNAAIAGVTRPVGTSRRPHLFR